MVDTNKYKDICKKCISNEINNNHKECLLKREKEELNSSQAEDLQFIDSVICTGVKK
jgi:hypothetical protein